MNHATIAAMRLQNQLVSHSNVKTAAGVLRHMCAIQGQDFAGVKWAIALRSTGLTDAAVEKAIAKAEIVRCCSLRGTLHMMAAEDVRWILQLAGPRMKQAYASVFRSSGIDGSLLKKAYHIFQKELTKDHMHTRQELKDLLEKNGIPTTEQRFSHLWLHASLDGLLCLGPRRDKGFTYVLLDEWVPEGKKQKTGDMVTLAKRYFESHCPATLADFAWWSGMKTTDARNAIEELGRKLEHMKVDGQTYHHYPTRQQPQTDDGAYLLPTFEEILLGYSNREALVPPKFSGEIIGKTKNGMIPQVIVTNGQISGTWRRTIKKDAVHISLLPFTKWTKAQRGAVQEKAEAYATFLRLKAVIE